MTLMLIKILTYDVLCKKVHLAREPNTQFLVNLHSDAVKGFDASM